MSNSLSPKPHRLIYSQILFPNFNTVDSSSLHPLPSTEPKIPKPLLHKEPRHHKITHNPANIYINQLVNLQKRRVNHIPIKLISTMDNSYGVHTIGDSGKLKVEKGAKHHSGYISNVLAEDINLPFTTTTLCPQNKPQKKAPNISNQSITSSPDKTEIVTSANVSNNNLDPTSKEVKEYPSPDLLLPSNPLKLNSLLSHNLQNPEPESPLGIKGIVSPSLRRVKVRVNYLYKGWPKSESSTVKRMKISSSGVRKPRDIPQNISQSQNTSQNASQSQNTSQYIYSNGIHQKTHIETEHEDHQGEYNIYKHRIGGPRKSRSMAHSPTSLRFGEGLSSTLYSMHNRRDIAEGKLNFLHKSISQLPPLHNNNAQELTEENRINVHQEESMSLPLSRGNVKVSGTGRNSKEVDDPDYLNNQKLNMYIDQLDIPSHDNTPQTNIDINKLNSTHSAIKSKRKRINQEFLQGGFGGMLGGNVQLDNREQKGESDITNTAELYTLDFLGRIVPLTNTSKGQKRRTEYNSISMQPQRRTDYDDSSPQVLMPPNSLRWVSLKNEQKDRNTENPIFSNDLVKRKINKEDQENTLNTLSLKIIPQKLLTQDTNQSLPPHTSFPFLKMHKDKYINKRSRDQKKISIAESLVETLINPIEKNNFTGKEMEDIITKNNFIVTGRKNKFVKFSRLSQGMGNKESILKNLYIPPRKKLVNHNVSLSFNKNTY